MDWVLHHASGKRQRRALGLVNIHEAEFTQHPGQHIELQKVHQTLPLRGKGQLLFRSSAALAMEHGGTRTTVAIRHTL